MAIIRFVEGLFMFSEPIAQNTLAEYLIIILLVFIGLIIAARKIPSVSSLITKYDQVAVYISYALLALILFDIILFIELQFLPTGMFFFWMIGLRWLPGINFKTYRKCGNIILTTGIILAILTLPNWIHVAFVYKSSTASIAVLIGLINLAIYTVTGLYYRYMEVSTFKDLIVKPHTYLKTDFVANKDVYGRIILNSGIALTICYTTLYVSYLIGSRVSESLILGLTSLLISGALIIYGLRLRHA